MAQPPTRNLLTQIFKNFVKSIRPRQIQGNHIGTDYFGTKYYEIPPDPGSGKRKPARWFEPKDKEDFDQELPAEWESWLRGRRIEPPNEAEIERNLQIMKMKKISGDKIEAIASAQRENASPAVVKGMDSFPKYDEYESTPGHNKHNK